MSAIIDACKRQDLELIRNLISKGTGPEDEGYYDSETFYIACRFGGPDVVRYFIESLGFSPNSYVRGQAPLLVVCMNSDYETAKLLMSKGACYEIQEYRYVGSHPIHFACSADCFEIVDLIVSRLESQGVKGSEITNIRDRDYRTPLHYACKIASPKLVSYLISEGANVDARSAYEETPLVFACSYYIGFDKKGETSFGHMCQLQCEVPEILLNSGADISGGVSPCSRVSPLVRALRGKCTEIVKTLIKRGAVLPDDKCIMRCVSERPEMIELARELIDAKNRKIKKPKTLWKYFSPFL